MRYFETLLDAPSDRKVGISVEPLSVFGRAIQTKPNCDTLLFRKRGKNKVELKKS